jgi:hypothetical protein
MTDNAADGPFAADRVGVDRVPVSHRQHQGDNGRIQRKMCVSNIIACFKQVFSKPDTLDFECRLERLERSRG